MVKRNIMIPVQLTIQGLYSYQEKQTIDFTKLTGASLFGIFGPVGSGKSSILEAITFAVYGRTDRLNLAGDNRYYNMMNLKSNELLIDFIFETGKDQSAYRAVVKGKRNSKKFEEVKTLDRFASIKEGNHWRSIGVEELEQAIGLSYENFKRTIIIPQGKFQEFLQLGNKDRTQMMKELFNLGKYEFYYKVTSLESKNNAEKQLVEGQLQQLGAVDPEQLDVYQAQLNRLEEEIKEQVDKLTENQKKEEQLRKLQELMQKKADAEKEQKKLQEQGPEFQALEKRILRYEQCVLRFKQLLVSLQETRKKQQDREKQIRIDSEKLKAEVVEIERLEKLLEAIKPAYEKREELKKKADELTRLMQMKTLEKTIAEEEVRLKNGKKILNETIQQLEELKAEKQQLETLIKEKRGEIPDLQLLATIRNWYGGKQNLDKHFADLKKEIDKQEKQEKDILHEKSQILASPEFDGLAKDADFVSCTQYLKTQSSKIKEKQKALGEEENHFRVKAQLKTYAEELEDGKPCPLCGSLHHPELFKTEDINDALAELSEKQKELEQQLEKIADWNNRLNILHSLQQTIWQNKKDLKEKTETQMQQIAAHNELFVWGKYREEKELDEAFDEAKRIQDEVKKLETALEIAAQKLSLDEKNRERYQTELEKIDKSSTVHITELKTLSNQLQLIEPEHYSQVPVKQLEKEKTDLLNEFLRIEKMFNENSTSLQERNKQKDTLNGSLTVNRKELEQELSAIEKLKSELDEQLGKSSFQSVDEVVQVLSEPIDTDAEKQKVAQFKEQLLRVKSSLEQLQNELKEQVYDAEAHKKLLGEIVVLKEQITQKNKEQGKVSELLKKLQKDLESQVLLRKQLEKLEIRAENIKTMKSLFKASGFVNYISSVYLQNLSNAANDRFFQLTRQKLSLEITADNNFQVRDFMNGGKVRNVKTLSGGQTFQAALSLALALADNIQKITQSNQNFFFLDEGFGSLDKDSLSVVFDALKTLRKENRIVGVISHVEEMQQEIDVHLRVREHEERGSIIYASWEG